MAKVYDIIPFFNELDVLEIRLNELDPVVDKFVICESHETFGGDLKPYHFDENLIRFQKFRSKIVHIKVPRLLPPMTMSLRENKPHCTVEAIRKLGRDREAYARDIILKSFFDAVHPQPNDYVIVSDCDEIPSADAVLRAKVAIGQSAFNAVRFKQYSFYYNVNTLVDYGRDVCSRARIGEVRDVEAVGGLMNFRKYKVREACEIENGGWHFSYFSGDMDKIREKVAALSPFLAEYKTLDQKAIGAQQDLHRRNLKFSELPETYKFVDDNDLPQFYLDNKDRFKHFTLAAFKERYK